MTLFSILICLGLQRYLHLTSPGPTWFNHYHATLRRSFAARCSHLPWLYVAIVLLPILLICTALTGLLHDVWLNSFNFLFQTAILFLCLDARPFKTVLAPYLRADAQQEQQAAFRHGLAFLEQENIPDGTALSRAVTKYVLLQTHQQLLAVLFWYILFGATGAAVYTAARLLKGAIDHAAQATALQKTAIQLFVILDWIPARLTALSYALVGHFAYAFTYLKQHLLNTKISNSELVVDGGLAALEHNTQDATSNDSKEHAATFALVDHSLVFWIVAIAVCTLASWIA
jgi:membrane protein required for beta-lactamase induction